MPRNAFVFHLSRDGGGSLCGLPQRGTRFAEVKRVVFTDAGCTLCADQWKRNRRTAWTMRSRRARRMIESGVERLL